MGEVKYKVHKERHRQVKKIVFTNGKLGLKSSFFINYHPKLINFFRLHQFLL